MKQNKYQIGDIVVFCESVEKMLSKDIKGISCDLTTQFHLLRHYKSLPKDYISLLIDKEYDYYDYDKSEFVKSILDRNTVEEGLKTKGSKFFSHVKGVETPKELIYLIRQQLKEEINNGSIFWIQRSSYKTAMFSFIYREDVGYDDLVSIDTLSEYKKSKITEVRRGAGSGENNIFIKTLTGIPRKTTRKISVELTKIPGRHYFSVTAFPGNLSPDFPNPQQNKAERDYCKKYWDTHVILE